MEGQAVALERLTPPDSFSGNPLPLEAPVARDGSFFYEAQKASGELALNAYDFLTAPLTDTTNRDVMLRPNPNYERYLRMHKVVVGTKGAQQLEEMYESLRQESMPRYLMAGGWAAVETALIRTDKPTAERLKLLDGGQDCWQRALATQRRFNGSNHGHLLEAEYPHRIALDLAVLPLLKDIIFGNVRPETCERVFDDCLNIAQSNAVYINLLKKEGHIQQLGEHVGFGYECNALLAFNRQKSETWFMIPSMTRSDTGYHHREQTHDLIVVHQKWGEVLSMMPVEIKSVAGPRERARYKALIVRGKLHLSEMGYHRPEQMLNAITALHEGRASSNEQAMVTGITERFIGMIRTYQAGERLGHIATDRSFTVFRDGSKAWSGGGLLGAA